MRSFELGADGAARSLASPQSEAETRMPVIDSERPILNYMIQDRWQRAQLFQKIICIQRPELLLKPDNVNKEKNL
ncbi:MAG: hypothetical protein H6797_03830 [Candidatus Nomurabacteria bacterium]|nr:MAG: hypothetical protein H6797_03830 [Candidatus Nomurabacteria bacterium]